MRIAHVDAEIGFSGGEVQVFLLLEGLRSAGLSQVLVAPPASAAARLARERGFEVREVPMRSDLDLAGLLGLARALRRSGADLAHLHTGRATWLGGLAARLAGIPALTTRRMDREVRRGPRTRLVHRVLTRRTVAISPAVRACLARGGVPDDRLRTIPSAVDPARLVRTRPAAAVRAELAVAEGRLLVLALGALVPRKGFDVLLEALARVADAPWELAIGGEGPERGALLARADSLGIGPRVRLLGRREDVPDLLGAADLVAMPSRREGLGVAALETLAVGRPLVASAVGGLGEAVVEGESGLLVPPGDVEALAAALRRLLDDGALRARLAAGGPARVAQGFLATQMVAAYRRLYEEILAEDAR